MTFALSKSTVSYRICWFRTTKTSVSCIKWRFRTYRSRRGFGPTCSPGAPAEEGPHLKFCPWVSSTLLSLYQPFSFTGNTSSQKNRTISNSFQNFKFPTSQNFTFRNQRIFSEIFLLKSRELFFSQEKEFKNSLFFPNKYFWAQCHPGNHFKKSYKPFTIDFHPNFIG